MHGTGNLEVKVGFEREGEKHELEVFLERRDKIYANFKHNGVLKKKKQVQGMVSVVIFEPSDVELFSKQPEARRKYLNMVLAQKDPGYLEALQNYKKALSMKNRLLSDMRTGQTSGEDLAEWNNQLVEYGSYIILRRKEFVEYANANLQEIYSLITGFNKPIELKLSTIEGTTLEQIQENFKLRLERNSEKEKGAGVGLVGPHRDDFSLESEGSPVIQYSSRGERRSQVLALKVIELEFLSEGDDKPILLLDDVLSELDETRRMFFIKYLQGKFQTFITTTHPLEIIAQHITLTPSIDEE